MTFGRRTKTSAASDYSASGIFFGPIAKALMAHSNQEPGHADELADLLE